jgi:uncharacterized cofD-like protein
MTSVVVIGGGTGSYTLLRGLKRHTDRITAIVSMFDSGGSTGRLRDEFGYLPPGDVRRCLLALAPEQSDTLILRQLLDHRFTRGAGLEGHSFGNLLLTALKDITGSELDAIEAASRILRLHGRVLPVTLDDSHLAAELEDGRTVKGETNIDIPRHDGTLRIRRLFLEPAARALPAALETIRNADLIAIGPGDLYTSVIPNLLVDGIPDAIRAAKAPKVYTCNLMTKPGETHGYTAADHLNEVMRYLGGPVDAIICNSRQGSRDLLRKYEGEQKYPVKVEPGDIVRTGVRLIHEDLINEPMLIRHDSEKLAKAVLSVAPKK